MSAARLVPRLSWTHGEPRATYEYVTDADAALLEEVCEVAAEVRDQLTNITYDTHLDGCGCAPCTSVRAFDAALARVRR